MKLYSKPDIMTQIRLKGKCLSDILWCFTWRLGMLLELAALDSQDVRLWTVGSKALFKV